MIELPYELLRFLDLEGMAVEAPGCPEQVNGRGNELQWDTNGHAIQVKDGPQDPIGWDNEAFVQLVPGDGVLVDRGVRFIQQGSNGLLEPVDVGDV